MSAPLIKGGQGRTADDVRDSGGALLWIGMACILVAGCVGYYLMAGGAK